MSLRASMSGALTCASSAVGVAALVAALVAAGACAGDQVARPETLFDGMPAAEAPIVLEGVDSPTILTTAVVEGRTGSRRRSCLEEWSFAEPSEHSVVRVSVHGESVTSLARSGRAVLACDNSSGSREAGRRWCGGAYGALRGGRLADPGLDLLCSTADGPLAFAWISPAPRARLVVIRQDGWAEAYPVVGAVPVRVASIRTVDPTAGTASFDVSEHDANGALVRNYSVDVRVAG